MIERISQKQEQLLLLALRTLRQDLAPGLTPRQRYTAAHIERCLTSVLGAPTDSGLTSQAAVVAHEDNEDGLQTALQRLDQQISAGLRGGRLSRRSRALLREELSITASQLARGERQQSPGLGLESA